MNIESSKNKNSNTFQEIIVKLDTKGWIFIKMREYQNSTIFKNRSGNKYLHIGDQEIIQQAIKIQSNLYQNGYPTPPILETGRLDNFSYLIEPSLGSQTFGDIFTKNIDNQTFHSFCFN